MNCFLLIFFVLSCFILVCGSMTCKVRGQVVGIGSLSFHPVDSRAWTQVFRLGDRHLYQLSYLTGPTAFRVWIIMFVASLISFPSYVNKACLSQAHKKNESKQKELPTIPTIISFGDIWWSFFSQHSFFIDYFGIVYNASWSHSLPSPPGSTSTFVIPPRKN